MIKNENYYQVAGWMLNNLQLKGNDLLIYAIIYGFSQDGEGTYDGSINYLCEFTGSSRATVIRSLTYLVENGLISKTTLHKNGVPFNSYKANDTGGIKMIPGGYQNDTEVVSKRDGGSIKMTPNNKLDNNRDNKEDKEEPSSFEIFRNENIEIIELMCEIFDISEINQQKTFARLSRFLFEIKSANQLEYFTNQFKSYIKLKSIEKSFIHGFDKYTGWNEAKTKFENGVWNQHDWSQKLKKQMNGDVSINVKVMANVITNKLTGNER